MSCLLNANKDPFSTVCRNLLTILPAITAPETLDLIRTVQLFTSHAAAAANHKKYILTLKSFRSFVRCEKDKEQAAPQ